ncbi:uncharacterized protein A1O9_02413 [Exophiala aquamarina CBS 119918]|uniref:Enoyl reductase (ER) domain-containing protein n=1 Tax=Exophiala aquamarina CBS 119918 TaxID=1182545 RepID=A0A072PLW2_9EURO|nr:uncharacterized protein A1O9_02413 [Exophiala aquamarina CBS 119918]KEF60851.1 hypothetical protein A1O9_02413 [Exophiala aquamarina CBS 119918]
MMKAARYYGKGDIRVEAVPIPEMGEGECLVEIEWCGICGSDLHEYLAGPIGIPTLENPHPLTGGHIPVTLGHEFCGRIKEANPGSRFRPGQPVMVDPHIACKGSTCHGCRSDKDHLCENLAFLGGSGAKGGGGLSEYAVVDEEMLHKIPDNVNLDHAAVIEPLVVANHVLKVTGRSLSELDVLIVGGGPIGIALACLLSAQDARIILSEPTTKRRDQAIGLQLIEKVVDPRSEDLGEACRRLTAGKGADVVFDCAGVQAALESAFDAIAYGGTYVNVAMWEKPLTIPFYTFFRKELRILSSCCYNREDFREVMEMMGDGTFQGYEKMITSRISLDDVVAKGFEELVARKDDHVKILISPKLTSCRA